MDEAAMAPPLKRRRLSSSLVEPEFSLDNSTAPADPIASYSHGIDSLQRTYSSLAPARTASQDNGLEQKVQHPAVGGIVDFQVLVPRQGTGSSSSSVSSTTSVVTSTRQSSSVTSMTSSISVSLSTTASSPTLPADTVPAGVTPSTSSSSTSPSSYASSTVSTSSNNETSTITSSASRSTSTVSTASSMSYNLTTSAIILEGASSTTTSKVTINLDNLTSSSSSTDTALLFVATLSDGDLTTFSRHSGDFVTTLRDGEVFTIPSISATTTRERTTTSGRTSTSSSSIGQSTITSTAVVGQGEATASYSSATSSTSTASGGGGGGSSSTPPAGTIAGGVVGGVAGLAVLVLIAMLFVRWYSRKSQVGHRALPAGSATSPESEQPTDRSGPGMAERAGMRPFAAAIPALFRHQNRDAESSAPSERGFTRVSGRKLPSAFSEGMSSEGARSQNLPPGMPLTGTSPPEERNLSSTSFYRDSAGFYGGDGSREGGRGSTSPTSPSSGAPIHGGPETMTMSPGPQRQPQLHQGGPYTMSSQGYPQSPPAAAAHFARSDTPASLRNSRFTEDM